MQHRLVPLLRQSVYSRLAGYEDTNDAERLAHDPAMRVVTGQRAPEKQAASTNTLSRFETEVLARDENLERLVHHVRWLVFQLAEVAVPREVFQGVLDRTGRLFPASG